LIRFIALSGKKLRYLGVFWADRQRRLQTINLGKYAEPKPRLWSQSSLAFRVEKNISKELGDYKIAIIPLRDAITGKAPAKFRLEALTAVATAIAVATAQSGPFVRYIRWRP
jgi:hypothetical protein